MAWGLMSGGFPERKRLTELYWCEQTLNKVESYFRLKDQYGLRKVYVILLNTLNHPRFYYCTHFQRSGRLSDLLRDTQETLFGFLHLITNH